MHLHLADHSMLLLQASIQFITTHLLFKVRLWANCSKQAKNCAKTEFYACFHLVMANFKKKRSSFILLCEKDRTNVSTKDLTRKVVVATVHNIL